MFNLLEDKIWLSEKKKLISYNYRHTIIIQNINYEQQPLFAFNIQISIVFLIIW